MDVVHADNHLLVVVKPAGVPTVPDETGDSNLLDQAKDWVAREYRKPGAVFLGVVHRLDRPVSGLVVFARTSKGAARLSEAFREGTVAKTYWGVMEGEPAEREGLREEWLVKDREARRVHVVPGPGGDARLARTRWKVLETGPSSCLIELMPLTGRSHQLRVAARGMGRPLLGDLKYGARAPLSDRSIALHAKRLELPHPTLPERLAFVAAPPEGVAWDFRLADAERRAGTRRVTV